MRSNALSWSRGPTNGVLQGDNAPATIHGAHARLLPDSSRLPLLLDGIWRERAGADGSSLSHLRVADALSQVGTSTRWGEAARRGGRVPERVDVPPRGRRHRLGQLVPRAPTSNRLAQSTDRAGSSRRSGSGRPAGSINHSVLLSLAHETLSWPSCSSPGGLHGSGLRDHAFVSLSPHVPSSRASRHVEPAPRMRDTQAPSMGQPFRNEQPRGAASRRRRRTGRRHPERHVAGRAAFAGVAATSSWAPPHLARAIC